MHGSNQYDGHLYKHLYIWNQLTLRKQFKSANLTLKIIISMSNCRKCIYLFISAICQIINYPLVINISFFTFGHKYMYICVCFIFINKVSKLILYFKWLFSSKSTMNLEVIYINPHPTITQQVNTSNGKANTNISQFNKQKWNL